MRDHRDDAPAPLLGWALCGVLSWLVLGAVALGLLLAVRALEGLL